MRLLGGLLLVALSISTGCGGDSGPSNEELQMCVEGGRNADRFMRQFELSQGEDGLGHSRTDSELLRACEEQFRTKEILGE